VDLPDVKETLTKIDIRTRQADYIAPEHLAVAQKMKEITSKKHNRIDPSDP
jgi:hypothetical protein